MPHTSVLLQRLFGFDWSRTKKKPPLLFGVSHCVHRSAFDIGLDWNDSNAQATLNAITLDE
jgi:hypothetical protein